MKKKSGITIRFGPLGLSLLAAGIAAIGVAAVSLADSGNGSGSQTFRMPAPPRGAAGMRIMGGGLSSEDRQKLEDFRRCMEDNGAPAPPGPGRFDPGEGPPKPPNAADRDKLHKTYEACRSKLPEKLRDAGPPGIGTFHCSPPPGPPSARVHGREQGQSHEQGQNQGQGRNENQSNQPGTQSRGSAA